MEAKKRRKNKGNESEEEEKPKPAFAQSAPVDAQGPEPLGAAAYCSQHEFRRLAGAVLTAGKQRPRVYVGNIEYWVTEQEITQLFGQFGTVVGINMPRDGVPPQTKGYCFVEYTEQSCANRAISAMQGFTLGGRQIRVSHPTQQRSPYGQGLSGILAVPQSGSTHSIAVTPTAAVVVPSLGDAVGSVHARAALSEMRRVTVSGFPSNFEMRDIRGIVNPFGTILRCDLLSPSASAIPPHVFGRVLVEYAEDKAAVNALRSLHGFIVGGGALQTVQGSPAGMASELTTAQAPPAALGASGVMAPQEKPLEIADKPPVVTTSKVMCLDNLVGPGEADEDLADEVAEECGSCGKVERVQVLLIGEKKEVRVIVHFKESKACGKAVSKMDGRWFGGRQVKAKPKEDTTR